jgi:hypothetical protein
MLIAHQKTMKRLCVLLLGVLSSAAAFAQFDPNIGAVKLNEILASGRVYANSNGSGYDRIELFNTHNEPVQLVGMALSDNTALPKYRFAPDAIIPANGFYVVDLDDDGVTNTFHINRTGDRVYFGYDLGDGNTIAPIDDVAFGQQITDVSLGRDPDGSGAWVMLLQMSFGGPNLGAPYGSQTNLVINEFMASSDTFRDYIEIYNRNTDPVDMGGMILGDTTAQYHLPPLTFIGVGKTNGFIVYYGVATPASGDELDFGLSRTSDAIFLKLEDGTLVDTLAWGSGNPLPEQQKEISSGRVPDGGTNIIKFPKHPTPGAPNFGLIDALYVNELLTHTDPPLEDAVEFYNPWTTNVNIGGWYLGGIEWYKGTPDGDKFVEKLKQYQFPPNTIVPAQGYLVVYEGQFKPNSPNGNFTFNSAHGGSLFLSQPNETGDIVAYLERTYPPSENGVSFGRITNSDGDIDFVAMACRSFGVDNPKSVMDFRRGTGKPNTCGTKWGPVIINELMYQPPDIDGTNNVIGEYIELRNTTGSRLPLFDPAFPTNGYKVKVSDETAFVFTNTDYIEANSFVLLVTFDPAAEPDKLNLFRSTYTNLPAGIPIRGPYDNNLSTGANGDIVELYRPDPPQDPINHPDDAGFVPYILVDRVHYEEDSGLKWPRGSQGTGLSLQRDIEPSYGDEPSAWRDDTPTPGSINAHPIIVLAQPQNQTVIVSNAAVFTFVLDPTVTEPHYQWLFKNKPLAGATNSTLNITFATRKNSGVYACVVTNPTGRVVSSNAVLTAITPVAIKTQPTSRTVATGGKVVFSAKATGTKPITYQWYLDGNPIEGATNSKLTLLNVGQANAGTYAAKARNVITSADSLPATLTVTP